jgi:fluoride ion exporter CrcB/FEX
MMAGIYVFASVFLSLIALIIGMVVAREVFA